MVAAVTRVPKPKSEAPGGSLFRAPGLKEGERCDVSVGCGAGDGIDSLKGGRGCSWCKAVWLA